MSIFIGPHRCRIVCPPRKAVSFLASPLVSTTDGVYRKSFKASGLAAALTLATFAFVGLLIARLLAAAFAFTTPPFTGLSDHVAVRKLCEAERVFRCAGD